MHGIVDAEEGITEDHLQPASLDLRLGPRAYRIRTSFLPGERTVDERLGAFQLGEGIDLRGRSGGVLEPGRPYLIPLLESLRLPANVRAYANPKSSTGRVDVFTRVVTDRSSRFDDIPAGYQGPLWLEVFTRSFVVKVRMGMALSQLRLIIERAVGDEGGTASPGTPPPVPHRLHIHLRPARLKLAEYDRSTEFEEDESLPVGFKAKRNNSALLDLGRDDHDPGDFWEPIWPSGQLVLEPEEFYLLRSQERIVIPDNFSAEMVAFEPTSGELRTHYAGFFDPGFGGDDLTGGLPAVLEVRAHDVPFMFDDGQEVARLHYQRLSETPDRLYSHEMGSHYAGARQRRFLSKHFRPWDQLPLRF